ncbi:hypothetical protein [Latilactobacillus curvatus]|uniref:hypothetical protein n=1 Tax=Latilactobacillus curvatus TaxID=28038 RepID=UPI00240F2D4A|nr:hypothetical protein [Latilactobacillus curvatus]
MAFIKRNFPTFIYLATLYLTYQILNTLIRIFTSTDILVYAKESLTIFIVFFGIFYFSYILFGVGLLYAGHVISKQSGNYEISLIILNILTTFSTLTDYFKIFWGADAAFLTFNHFFHHFDHHLISHNFQTATTAHQAN